MFTRTLVGRLAISFLLPSLVVLSLMAFIAYLQARRALLESVHERLEILATVKEAAFNDWVAHLFHDAMILAEIPDVVRSTALLDDAATGAAQNEDAYRVLSHVLALVRQTKPSFTELFVMSPAGGKVLVSTDEKSEGQFRIYDRYYVKGKESPFLQNVYPSPMTLSPTMTISMPIRGERGTTIGVLAAHLSLDYLDKNILQRIGLGESGVVTLIDQYRVLITGRHYGEPGLGIGNNTSLAIEEVIQGKSGWDSYRNLEGGEVIGVYRWLQQRGVGLIVEIDQVEAFQPARRLALAILQAGIIFLAALAVIIYLVARQIARPILATTAAARKVSAGDLSSEAPVLTHDELGTLAATFNRMVVQLRKLYSDMAEKISELETAEEKQEGLIHELEAKNAELEQFAYTVSHDLKGPLLTIKGFLGFLDKDMDSDRPERAREDLRRISDAADKMGQLLNELLELSRIGRVVNPPEEISFRQLAVEAIEAVIGQDSRITVRVAEELPHIYGDRVRLAEVVENLVANACKFMGSQEDPRVEIGARRDHGETVFYVRDNGVGVDPSYHDKIFGLFERLETNVEGTGIGLAIVRRIVEFHDGRIWVESKGQGQGSTFCFTLPPLPEGEGV